MSSPIRKPIARPSNGRSFDELAGTNHGNSSISTRNRLPVQRPASAAAERIIPVVDLLHRVSKNKTPNTSTAQLFMTTKTKRRGGGKRKKGKTQKKGRSTKKRNNRKRI